jgi:hypothetical protein
MGTEESTDERAGEFSARMSDDKTRCEIVVRFGDVGFAKVRLDREETFRLGQTLLLMTGSMHDDRS